MVLCVEQVYGAPWKQELVWRNACGLQGGSTGLLSKARVLLLWPLLENLLLFGETQCKAVSEECFCFADDKMIWLYWCITGICVLLVGSVITAVLCMTKIRAGETHTSQEEKNPMIKKIFFFPPSVPIPIGVLFLALLMPCHWDNAYENMFFFQYRTCSVLIPSTS